MKAVHKKGGTLEMVAIALPMVVSQACDTVMIFTDRLFLAKLQPELMNAAMGGGLTVFMMMSFFLGLGRNSLRRTRPNLQMTKLSRCWRN